MNNSPPQCHEYFIAPVTLNTVNGDAEVNLSWEVNKALADLFESGDSLGNAAHLWSQSRQNNWGSSATCRSLLEYHPNTASRPSSDYSTALQEQ